MKLRKEIDMVDRYNLHNEEKIDMVIDNFKGEYWFTDRETGRRLSTMEEKKIWEYYED